MNTIVLALLSYLGPKLLTMLFGHFLILRPAPPAPAATESNIPK